MSNQLDLLSKLSALEIVKSKFLNIKLIILLLQPQTVDEALRYNDIKKYKFNSFFSITTTITNNNIYAIQNGVNSNYYNHNL